MRDAGRDIADARRHGLAADLPDLYYNYDKGMAAAGGRKARKVGAKRARRTAAGGKRRKGKAPTRKAASNVRRATSWF